MAPNVKPGVLVPVVDEPNENPLVATVVDSFVPVVSAFLSCPKVKG